MCFWILWISGITFCRGCSQLASSAQLEPWGPGGKIANKNQKNNATLQLYTSRRSREKIYASLGAPPRPGGPKENCKQFPPAPWGVPPVATYATGRNKAWQPLRHTEPTELSTTRELSDKSEKNNYRKKQKRRGVVGAKTEDEPDRGSGGLPKVNGTARNRGVSREGGRGGKNQEQSRPGLRGAIPCSRDRTIE